MPTSKKPKSAQVVEAKKAPEPKGAKSPSAPPASPAPPRKGAGKKKGKKGRRKKKGPKLSPEEQRRLELVKWMSVRPQLLAERIAQNKIEMPYFLQVEYNLMADKALTARELDQQDKCDKAIEEKQLKERDHLIEVSLTLF